MRCLETWKILESSIPGNVNGSAKLKASDIPVAGVGESSVHKIL